MPQSGTSGTRPLRISPTPGSPFGVMFRDLKDAIRLAPMWLHIGWVDMDLRYRRTRIGPFWHSLSLGVYTLVMGVIWSAALKDSAPGYFRFLASSLIVWGLLSSFILEGATTFISGEPIVLSIRFSYLALTFEQIWKALILLAYHLLVYVLVILVTWKLPDWHLLLAIPGLLLVVANGFWMTTLSAIIGLRRRDFIPAVSSVVQLAMFVTPVFWPKDSLGPKLAYLADLNPLYHLVQIVRAPMLGLAPSLYSWMYCIGTLFVGGFATLFLYGRYRDKFSYWY